MTFALVLACTVAACFALRNPLKACPMAFYAAALLVDVAFVAGTFWGMPREVWSVFFVLIQKCLLPLALFVVVMYIGVLDRGSRACMWLKPVRAELSIVAWLLSLGHVAVYGATYLPRIATGGATNGNVVASFAVAVVLLALLVALVVSFLMTPIVKTFAYKVGAIDVPKDARRMHKTPIPRLGGLAIFIGFMVSILLFVEITAEMRSILLGAVIIVVLGVVDDIMALPALLKFVVQIVAALIPATHGVVIQAFSNPNVFSDNPYWVLGNLSVPLTVLWIVAITNAVNLIDGLDGLANGVSAISATTVLVIALIGGQFQVAVVMAALVGACVGFMPYNMNPAKMFMGDTGATFLGYILATMSIQGLFKFYAIISFAVPFLILGLPIFDTAFAFIRRIAHGQSPMHADRSHIHHRLIDMGLNQKQAVATLYVISAILGLSAVVLTTSGEGRAMLLFLVLCIVAVVAARVVFPKEVKEELHEELEELKEHGHHGHHPADKPEDDGKTEEK